MNDYCYAVIDFALNTFPLLTHCLLHIRLFACVDAIPRCIASLQYQLVTVMQMYLLRKGFVISLFVEGFITLPLHRKCCLLFATTYYVYILGGHHIFVQY